ncbi:hypothetical protein M9H77_35771 [Catharanthus roseus]|uniref:Uncharacterized protein n=1 Tax=Catharanthus roseus TaxID=4058 RepID=A0ACB9ZSJ2_CATRO|nr:hypothetical protein M9H77_35771 [Catharanthus roseus]
MHKRNLKGNLQRSKRSLKTTRVYEDQVIKLKTLKTRRMVRDSFPKTLFTLSSLPFKVFQKQLEGENWLCFGEGHLTADSSPAPIAAYRLLPTESSELTHLLSTIGSPTISLKSLIEVLQKKEVILGKELNFYSLSALLLSRRWESVVVACGDSVFGGSVKEKLVPWW